MLSAELRFHYFNDTILRVGNFFLFQAGPSSTGHGVRTHERPSQ
jgi:hypothetical protein